MTWDLLAALALVAAALWLLVQRFRSGSTACARCSAVAAHGMETEGLAHPSPPPTRKTVADLRLGRAVHRADSTRTAAATAASVPPPSN